MSKYKYGFEEWSQDTRRFRCEMQDLAWSVEQIDGESFRCNEGTATFIGTEYGDDAQYQMEEGEEDLKDD